MGHRLSFLKNLAPVAVVLAGCASNAGSTGASNAPRAPNATAALLPLPPVPVTTMDGTPTELARALAGQPALVSLWATWCDACIDEIGALNRLSTQISERGRGAVVGVAVGEDRGTVTRFVQSHGLRYARFVDGDFALADALGERRVPTTLVVDANGRIVYRGGAFDEAALAAFRSVLGRKETATTGTKAAAE